LLSTSNLGQISAGDANVVQEFTATTGCVTPDVFQGCTQVMGQVFWSTSPVPTLYVWDVHDVLRAYQFSNGLFNTTQSGGGAVSQAHILGPLWFNTAGSGDAASGSQAMQLNTTEAQHR
jgi:hypothetical protein